VQSCFISPPHVRQLQLLNPPAEPPLTERFLSDSLHARPCALFCALRCQIALTVVGIPFQLTPFQIITYPSPPLAATPYTAFLALGISEQTARRLAVLFFLSNSPPFFLFSCPPPRSSGHCNLLEFFRRTPLNMKVLFAWASMLRSEFQVNPFSREVSRFSSQKSPLTFFRVS